MQKSEYLSKRMSEGFDLDPNSPEIVAELLDVSLHFIFYIYSHQYSIPYVND